MECHFGQIVLVQANSSGGYVEIILRVTFNLAVVTSYFLRGRDGPAVICWTGLDLFAGVATRLRLLALPVAHPIKRLFVRWLRRLEGSTPNVSE